MLKALSIILFLLASYTGFAQEPYYVYLQTPSAQPFFVRIDDKIIPSQPGGYLILSELPAGDRVLMMGFPPSRSTYRFTIPIADRDRGFMVQPGSDPVLQDLQTETNIGNQQFGTNGAYTYTYRTDDFSRRLARVVNDSSLLAIATPVTKPEPPPAVVKATPPPRDTASTAVATAQPAPDTTTTVITTPTATSDTMTLATANPASGDTVAAAAVQPVGLPTISASPSADTINIAVTDPPRSDTETVHVTVVTMEPDPLQDSLDRAAARQDSLRQQLPADAGMDEAELRTHPRKYAESSTSQGFGMVFVDPRPGGIDTIRLVIDNPKYTLVETSAPVAQDSSMIQRETVKTQESPVEEAVRPVKPVITLPENCPGMASEAEISKLRKAMQRGSSDESMVSEAKKLFKNKCLTTDQVRDLSQVFKTSAGKYVFYDAAYLHVSDREQFPALASEITDDYYARRFKALVGQ